MAQWQVSLVDGLMDFSFSILIALFYASVLSARYGKTKFRVIVSAVMITATIITDLLHTPQTTKFFLGIFILMGCIFILSDDKPLKRYYLHSFLIYRIFYCPSHIFRLEQYYCRILIRPTEVKHLQGFRVYLTLLNRCFYL